MKISNIFRKHNKEPEDETVELTLDQIAEKFDVPVEKLRIKKEE